jgi:hypothetical protein
VTTPSNEAQLATLVAQQQMLGSAVGEMKEAMHKMANAMQRLALLDERQINDREALGRAFKDIEKVDLRIKRLEDAAPLNKQSSDWIRGAVQQVVSSVITVVLALVVGSKLAPAPTAPTPKHEVQTTQ